MAQGVGVKAINVAIPSTSSPGSNDDVIASLWKNLEERRDCAEALRSGSIAIDCEPTAETRFSARLFGVPCGNQESVVAYPGDLQDVDIVEVGKRPRLTLL